MRNVYGSRRVSVAANPFLCGIKGNTDSSTGRWPCAVPLISGTGGQMEAYAILSCWLSVNASLSYLLRGQQLHLQAAPHAEIPPMRTGYR